MWYKSAELYMLLVTIFIQRLSVRRVVVVAVAVVCFSRDINDMCDFYNNNVDFLSCSTQRRIELKGRKLYKI